METTTNIRLNQRTRAAGFTLAEVVLAVAVVAFGLIAVLGVLPVGLNTTRDNRDETIIIQDVEFWMNGIRGGRLSMDALNNVEWVEVTVAQQGEANKTYRADYATVINDSSVFEFNDLVPVFPNGANAEREEYLGVLKQASWRTDVLGWLSIPDSNGTALFIKRAKIRPLGATLRNQLLGIKDNDGQYVHDGGDLTFSYLLESRIEEVEKNFWTIELKASWPIIEEGVDPETGKWKVTTGHGKRTFVGHISAPLTKAWSQVDVGMLPDVSQEAQYIANPVDPPELITFYLSPGFIFNSVWPGEKLSRNELVDYLISRLFSNVLKVGRPKSGDFYLDNSNSKPNALQKFLSAKGSERTETFKEMEDMLLLLETHADFLKDLNILLHMHGITLKSTSNGNAQSSGSGGFLSGLGDAAGDLAGIKDSMGIPAGGNVDDIMAQLDQLEADNRAEDELFGNAGVNLDALMGNPLMVTLLGLLSNPNSPGLAGILELIKNSIGGNQGMLDQFGDLEGQLGNIGQILNNSGIGTSLPELLTNRQNRNDYIEGKKKQITSITGGAIDAEDLRNKLKELEQDVKRRNDLNKLLIKHGITKPDGSGGFVGDFEALDTLMDALDLKSDIIIYLIAPLLDKAFQELTGKDQYLRRINLNGNIYYMQAEAYDSFGRYSLKLEGQEPEGPEDYFREMHFFKPLIKDPG